MTGSTHDVAAATRWFAQWNCYRTIVDHDWMSHAAIAAAIRDRLGHRRRPFAVLDLGCGDADPAIRALSVTAAAGFDTSSPQLFADTSGFHRLLRFTAAPRAS